MILNFAFRSPLFQNCVSFWAIFFHNYTLPCYVNNLIICQNCLGPLRHDIQKFANRDWIKYSFLQIAWNVKCHVDVRNWFNHFVPHLKVTQLLILESAINVYLHRRHPWLKIWSLCHFMKNQRGKLIGRKTGVQWTSSDFIAHSSLMSRTARTSFCHWLPFGEWQFILLQSRDYCMYAADMKVVHFFLITALKDCIVIKSTYYWTKDKFYSNRFAATYLSF